MKKIFVLLFLLFSVLQIFANGVCIISAEQGNCLQLRESVVQVTVENQVAIVTATQTFKNSTTSDYAMKYAFPMYEDASATNLRWNISGNWYQALISPTEQDSIPGEGNMDSDLQEYLGNTPLFISYEDNLVSPDSLITVELTYVQLLPYQFGDVHFSYKNDYSLIQTTPLLIQKLDLELISLRTIENIELLSHIADAIENSGNLATINFQSSESQANQDYEVTYSLSLDELGLFNMSTFISPDDVPDEFGNGFFTFIAEPEPSADVINKVFTLMIDRSGSMEGNKFVQAQNAASYIVNNLNEGDNFNIVDFAGTVSSVFEEHTAVSASSRDEALSYISSLVAWGGTNISQAFNLAVPQFETANDNTANIIIFFTDGEPYGGIEDTELLAEYVHDLIQSTETNINLFSFGIGQNINYQLLNLVGNQNNGFAYFLEDNELELVISDFYEQIRNPVLLDIELEFTPDSVVDECYPVFMPNLYVGKQLIISGRYSEAVPVNLQMSGNAFGNSVEYNFDLTLSDSINTNYQFLTKIWAKQKIEHLLIEYYSYPEDSEQAQTIYDEIVQISIDYGVITPFTSFSGPGVGFEEEEIEPENDVPVSYEIVGNYPNPFNPSTDIRFNVFKQMNKNVAIKIFNVKGQLVRILGVHVNQPGQYQVHWDGTDMNGEAASSGLYFYIIDFGEEVLSSKMMLIK